MLAVGARSVRLDNTGYGAQTERRKFASVSDAVVEVLAEGDSELRYIEIYNAVEALLEGPVARSSVKNALASERTRKQPRFERIGRGRYRASSARPSCFG